MAMTQKQKTELLKEAINICERVSNLLDQCYLDHCRAVGMKPQLP